RTDCRTGAEHSVDNRQAVSFLYDVTLSDVDLSDRARLLGKYRYLHLHRLQQRDGVTGIDLVPGRDHDLDDVRHEVGDDLLGHRLLLGRRVVCAALHTSRLATE